MPQQRNPKPPLIAKRHEVLRPIGRGGMGKVFLVRDHQTGRKLALKLLRSHTADDPKLIERFRREIAAIQQLQHPGVVRFYEANTEGDRLFYTMEYLDGKTLRAWLTARGRLAFGSVVRVLCLVAHTLEHVHTVTVHRDLSPENIMVMRDGSVRLLDFGLVKRDTSTQQLTMIGQSLGKFEYVAPEQRLNARGVDARADIYPLGVMFFEMLTGQLPVAGASIAGVRKDVPAACDAFAQRAMAGRPSDRFASAREFREALLALYEAHEQAAAEPPAVKPPQTPGNPAAESSAPADDAAMMQPAPVGTPRARVSLTWWRALWLRLVARFGRT